MKATIWVISFGLTLILFSSCQSLIESQSNISSSNISTEFNDQDIIDAIASKQSCAKFEVEHLCQVIGSRFDFPQQANAAYPISFYGAPVSLAGARALFFYQATDLVEDDFLGHFPDSYEVENITLGIDPSDPMAGLHRFVNPGLGDITFVVGIAATDLNGQPKIYINEFTSIPQASANSELSVTALRLMGVDGEQDTTPNILDNINDGYLINLHDLPLFTIEALTTPDVNHVTFHVDFEEGEDYVHTEQVVPYTINGNPGSSNAFSPWLLSPGFHVITATPYDENGLMGSGITVGVTIIDTDFQPTGPSAIITGSLTYGDTDGDGQETINLSGANSTDSDGQIVSYRWMMNSQVLGNNVTLNTALGIGQHRITLQVTDNSNLTDEAFVDVVVSNVNAEQILPGNGWSGSTTQPSGYGSGPGANAKAIARWDVVPLQTFGENFQVGVVAFHRNGIDRVEVAAEGGQWVAITEMTLNPRTRAFEYWAKINASDFSDGRVELRAIAYPKVAGQPKLLDSLVLYTNHGSAIAQSVRWVDSVNGSDGNSGASAGNAFRTIGRALNSVQAANGGFADGGIINLLPGNYRWGLDGYQAAKTNARWVNIQAAPGVSRDQVRFTSTVYPGFKTDYVHVKGVTFTPSSVPTTDQGPNGGNRHLWAEDVDFQGPGPGPNSINSRPFNSLQYKDDKSVWIVDSDIADYETAFKFGLMARNVRIFDIGSDAYTGVEMVVNCSLDGIYPGPWNAFIDDVPGQECNSNNNKDCVHPDVFQATGSSNTVSDNVIVFGLDAKNFYAQGIFMDDIAAVNNMAIVNAKLAQAAGGGYSSQFKDPTFHNVLFHHVTLINQRMWWRQANMQNLDIVGSYFHEMLFNINPDIVAQGLRHVHVNIVPSDATSAISSGGEDVTLGNPPGLFEDAAAGNYKPSSSSILLNRVPSPRAPIDLTGALRGTPTAIGVYAGNGE